MPQFIYRGRDKDGQLRTGERVAISIDQLNAELVKEGISPLKISLTKSKRTFWALLQDSLQGKKFHLQELAVFSRQMELLHSAGVPIVTALKQLIAHTRSHRLLHALQGVIAYLEKGQGLGVAMQYYPETFSPMVVNIVQMGENTGHLSEAFAHLYQYLEFEITSTKQIKSAFRYPMFVGISIILTIVVLNIFVIPTFARFYQNLSVSLPWQTELLIGISNFFTHYGFYLLAFIIVASYFTYRYLHTPKGQYRWGKLQLQIPWLGKLLKRIILIRFAQSMAIILNAGVPINQGLSLIKNIVINSYISEQISRMQEAIERGQPLTQAILKVDLFSSLEIQILAVGEKNGELGPGLNYISNFHGREIEYDLKRINDWIGPIMIAGISGLVLIIALGVYLPIWNMISLVH